MVKTPLSPFAAMNKNFPENFLQFFPRLIALSLSLVLAFLSGVGQRALADDGLGPCLLEMHRILATKANGDFGKRRKARELARQFFAAREALLKAVEDSNSQGKTGFPYLNDATYYPVVFDYQGVPHRAAFLVGVEPATAAGVGFPEWVIKFYPQADVRGQVLKIVYKVHPQFSVLDKEILKKIVEVAFVRDRLRKAHAKARAVGRTHFKVHRDIEGLEKSLFDLEKEIAPYQSQFELDKIKQILEKSNPAVFAGLEALSKASDEDLFSPIELWAQEEAAKKMGGRAFQLLTYF